MHMDINRKLIHKGRIIYFIKLCYLFTVLEELQWALKTGTVARIRCILNGRSSRVRSALGPEQGEHQRANTIAKLVADNCVPTL